MRERQINRPRVYGELLLNKLFYDKLSKEIKNDILKFYTHYLVDELTTFDINIDKLIKYYEDLERKDFMVEKQEIVVDLVEKYSEWFKINRSECDENTVKQYYTMFKRLENIYFILKPIKNDFKDIYFQIEKYKEHRLFRRNLLRLENLGKRDVKLSKKKYNKKYYEKTKKNT